MNLEKESFNIEFDCLKLQLLLRVLLTSADLQIGMAILNQKSNWFSPLVEVLVNPFCLSVCGMCVRPERKIREKVGHQSPEKSKSGL